MADQILVEYRAGFDGLKADAESIKKEFKGVEDAGVKAGEKTSNSFDKATESTKSLKTQLKDLKAQIATATDPKEVERLSKAAGELSDKINDANESVKVFASGSKFQQLGNSLGSIVSNLRGLDFQRANEQAKVFAGISRTITFKEGLSGLKDLGGTFLSLGKSLLLNPLFLIPTLITAIITNFDKLKASGGLVGETFKAIGKIVEVVTIGAKGFLENMGLINTQAMELYERQKENLENLSILQKKNSDRIIQILQSQGRETFKIQQQSIIQELNLNEKKYQALRQAIINGVIDEEEGYKQIKELGEKKADIITSLSVVHNQETKKIIEDNKKLAKQAEDLAKVLRDLRTGNIVNEFDRERQALADKLADDVEKYRSNGAIIVELRIKAANELQKIAERERTQAQAIDQEKLKATQEGVNARIKLEQDFEDEYSSIIDNILDKELKGLKAGDDATKESVMAREKLQQDLATSVTSLIGTLSQIYTNFQEEKLNESNMISDAELEKLQKQYDSQLISKEDYEEKKNSIEDEARQRERQIKRDEFELQKNASLIQATIATAQGVATALTGDPYTVAARVALAAAIGAAQIALIASQPTPKFEKGGKVGGKRHSAGGTLIEAEQGEFVTRRDMALKHDRMLTAINAGQMESFIKVHYIVPAIREHQKKAGEIVIKKDLASSWSDNKLLDSLKMSRSNDREIALMIVNELKKSRNYNPRNF